MCFFKGREILPSLCSCFKAIWRNKAESHTFLSWTVVWIYRLGSQAQNRNKCTWGRRQVKEDLALVIPGSKFCQDCETLRVLAGVASQSTYAYEHRVLRKRGSWAPHEDQHSRLASACASSHSSSYCYSEEARGKKPQTPAPQKNINNCERSLN